MEMENTQLLPPALYLIPSGMSDAAPSHVVPDFNIRVIREIRHFIVEDVRTARRWIRRCDPTFDFEGVEFVVLNTRTAPEEVAGMLEPLRRGFPLGVMSEAGCPAVADPGADIVAVAQKEGYPVEPLVGPSSILMGLMGSGFNGQSFCFHGYLPIDDEERKRALHRLESESEKENRTQIFIETPYRNDRLLRQMTETLRPDTKICIAADITAPETQTIVTKDVAEWKRTGFTLGKRPTIFLLYRGHLRKGGQLIYTTKRKGAGR